MACKIIRQSVLQISYVKLVCEAFDSGRTRPEFDPFHPFLFIQEFESIYAESLYLEETMSTNISDIWSSLQEEEVLNKKEYRNRYESLKKKSSDDAGLLSDFTSADTKKKAIASKKKSISVVEKKVKSNAATAVREESTPSYENGNIPVAATPSAADLPTKMTFQEVLPKIRRFIEGLNSENSSIRRRSLDQLITQLFGDAATSQRYVDAHGNIVDSCMSDEDYSLLFHEIGRPIFRLFADSIEKCRELSMQVTNMFVHKCVNFVPILCYFFPAIMERLPSNIGYDDNMHIFVYDLASHEAYQRGKAVDRQDKINTSEASIIPFTFKESSEEIRLLSYQVINALVARMESSDALSILQPYFHDLIMYLQIGLRDPYPNVKACVLETLEHIASLQKDFELGVKYYAVAIVRAVLPILRHRHARIRACAVTCITAYFLAPDKAKCKGAGTDAIVDLIGFHEENVLSVAAFYKPQVQVNYLAELVMDNTSQVREATVKMLDQLLSLLPDRYDHTSRLLPYLLDFLTDDNIDEVVTIAMNCLVKCGKIYEDEHQEEILDRRQYGVDGDHRMNLDKALPYPFHEHRPRIGIRLFVRGHVKRFIHVLIKEIMNWKSATRMKSVKLLKVAVILSEESITIEAAAIFPALLKAMHHTKHEDADPIVHKVLGEVAELMGRYIHPDVYLHYLLPRLRGDLDVVGGMGTDVKMRVIVMETIGCMLSGSKPKEILGFLDSLVDCLCDEYVISRESSSLQSAALELLLSILDVLNAMPSDSEATNGPLKDPKSSLAIFDLLLWNLQSMSHHDRVVAAMQGLASYRQESVSKMFQCLGQALLNELMQSAQDLEEFLPRIRCLVEAPYMIALQNQSIVSKVLTFFVHRASLAEGGRIPLELSVTLCSLLRPLAFPIDSLAYLNSEQPSNPSVYHGLPQESSTSISITPNILAAVVEVLPAILKYFALSSCWNLNEQYSSQRLTVLSYLIGYHLPAATSQQQQIILELLPQDEFYKIVSDIYLPALTLCKQPTSPQASRRAVVGILNQIIYICKAKASPTLLSSDRIKAYVESTMPKNPNLQLAVQPAIALLMDMLCDASDEIRSSAIGSLLSAVVFILPDDHGYVFPPSLHQIYIFSSIVQALLDEMFISRASSLEEYGDEDMAIDSLLRSIAVLDAKRMDEILRTKITAGVRDDHRRDLLSELIDHAGIILDLQAISRAKS
jgi:hypothetical protein